MLRNVCHDTRRVTLLKELIEFLVLLGSYKHLAPTGQTAETLRDATRDIAAS